MWEKELETAKIAAVKAGKAIMEIYNNANNMHIEYKDGNMPLTVADKTANQLILDLLKRNFPTYAILSEEAEDNKKRLENDLCFIVDPLDGTKEFIKKNGQFTVNIALAYQHRSVMGVIYVPAMEDLYFACEGYGSYRQYPNGFVEKIHVSNNTDIKTLRIVLSSSHGCAEMDQLLNKYKLTHFVKVGSSIKGCMVANGQADVYYRFNPTMEWDTAAMQCIAEEAGAIFRQMDGSVMAYNRENSLNAKGFYIINHIDNLFV